MRKLTWRLPVLIAAVAAIPAAPAHAADEGDVGVRDRVIRVSARATLPGADVRSGGESDGCTWRLMIENDRLPVYDVDGRQLFSDTGRWFQRVCNGQPVDVNGLFVLPEGGGFSIPDLTEQALDALDPGDPTWSASPNGTTVPMVTQLPTYFWVEPAYWTATRTVRVETPSGRVWAEAVGRPTVATFDAGDGTATRCESGGAVWAPGGASAAEASPCALTFRHSSAGTAGRELTATVEFAVEGRTSTNPTPAPAGTLARTSPPITVQVAEIQAVATASR